MWPDRRGTHDDRDGAGTRLSVDERLELIGAVWDSIDHSTRPVSPAVSALIGERVADAKANPLGGQDWEVARRELRKRYRA